MKPVDDAVIFHDSVSIMIVRPVPRGLPRDIHHEMGLGRYFCATNQVST